MDRYALSPLCTRAQQASVGDLDIVERRAGAAATTAATAIAATEVVCTAPSLDLHPSRSQLGPWLRFPGVTIWACDSTHSILARVRNVPFSVWHVRLLLVCFCTAFDFPRFFGVSYSSCTSFPSDVILNSRRARASSLFVSERLMVCLDQHHSRASASAATDRQPAYVVASLYE